MSASKFRTSVMPGLVFQGVLIGGGYGTGCEIVADEHAFLKLIDSG
jgi:hypothetical protein